MSELLDMLNNPNHKRLSQTSWNDMKYYIRRNNTIYRLIHFYQGKKWLLSQSQKFKDNDYRCYIPIATKQGETYIGYIWERANMSNYLLLHIHLQTQRYPNLHWCDIGNHPYPKEIRMDESWLQCSFNKVANRLVHPDFDITKAVLFPSDLGLSPTTP